MRILFRADASEAIGTGHVMRCAALAEGLRARGGRVVFACQSLPAPLATLLREMGFELATLASQPAIAARASPEETLAPAAQRSDAAAVRSAVAGENFDWIVVDHYALDACWEDEVRGLAGRALAIDDLPGRAHRCDLLLDQNPGEQREARYRARACADLCCLIGARYALLRRGFAAARARSGPRPGPIARILVMYGGTDPTDETGKAVRALQSMPDMGAAVDVVVGGANPRAGALRAACARDPRMRFHYGTADVPGLMAAADLALGACGTSSWERCAVYLPALAVITAGNQRDIGDALASTGAAEVAGWHADVAAEDLAGATRRLAQAPDRVRAMSKRAGAQTDALGVERVVAAMEEIHAH
jgi:UDP-2,4-diacetamido-2,4,6-trideoxy-beta-L-altropyranose hydrolase